MHNSNSLIMAILAASASAGTFFVDNCCPFPMYLETTSSPVSAVSLPANTVNAYTEIMCGGANSCEETLTISRTADIAEPMQFNYAEPSNFPGVVYYSLSTVYGDPLMAEGFQILTAQNGTGPNCPPRSAGQDCPDVESSGNPENDNAMYLQSDSGDYRLTLCKFNQTATT
jgi:hypothetical protein